MSLILANQMVLTLFCLLLLWAAYQDLSEYKISNRIVLSVLALTPVYLLTSPAGEFWALHILVGAGFFFIGMILFKFGYMGGGDVKLISASMLLLGPQALMTFFIGMGLAGGIMALFMISPLRLPLAHLCGQAGFLEIQTKIMTNKLPYGVAICAGGLFSSYLMITNM